MRLTSPEGHRKASRSDPGSTRIAPHRLPHARLFVSFDQENDGDLHDRLVAEARDAESGFEIAARSGELTMEDPWEEAQRKRIRESDLMVVLCGEHTDQCRRVAAELRMAQEEGIPYFFLWGRREVMCKLPEPARKSDGMYSWTAEILRDRIRMTTLKAEADEELAASLEARKREKAEKSEKDGTNS